MSMIILDMLAHYEYDYTHTNNKHLLCLLLNKDSDVQAHSNIKVNVTNHAGQRTSTTVSYVIAEFYCQHVLGQDTRIDEPVRDLIANEITELVKTYNLQCKEAIEEKLLFEIYNYKVRQLNLSQ